MSDPHRDHNPRIAEEYSMGVDDLLRIHEGLMNFVIKDYLTFNQNLLEKNTIVFPCNIKNSHWAATFVFNPGGIEATDAVKQRGLAKPCFFRYCSQHPDGSRGIDRNKGVIWFLNLVYSYEKHQVHKMQGSMKWYAPFSSPSQITGLMKGTLDFPAVRAFSIIGYI